MSLSDYWEEDCPYNQSLKKIGIKSEGLRAGITFLFALGLIIGSIALANWWAVLIIPAAALLVGGLLKIVS